MLALRANYYRKHAKFLDVDGGKGRKTGQCQARRVLAGAGDESCPGGESKPHSGGLIFWLSG